MQAHDLLRLSSVCQAPLMFCVTVMEKFCEQDVYREKKGEGALLSAIVNHHGAVYSYPAFKSLVEDAWPVTKQCFFSRIHCMRDLLL